MSSVIISPSALHGTVRVPSSKSAGHRALICAFLSGCSTVNGIDSSQDILATQNALAALQNGDRTVDCHESGSTLRFMIPLAAALGRTVTFVGSGKLPQRPIDEYLRLLPAHGVTCRYNGSLPLTVSGQLQSGVFSVRGDVSSQYITGLLLALPLLDGDSEIRLTTALLSAPYVDMTVKVMRDFGVTVNRTENGFFVKGKQTYQPCAYTVEGDWSQAAFFMAAGALHGPVHVTGLDWHSTQGDREIATILKRFGAALTVTEDGVTVSKAPLHGITVDVSNIPDTAPTVAVLGALASGTTVITGGERLRIKESDRIACVVNNLKKAGIQAQETPDGMIIKGGLPSSADLEGYNDHRIVMAMSVLALAATGRTQISEADSIRKSYPDFFNDYNSLGGKADVIGDRK